MNHIELPFCYDNSMNGECYTFYRFAVMLTRPEMALPWFGTKMNFFMGDEYSDLKGWYGNADGKPYGLSYYNDILIQRENPILNIGAAQVCQVIEGNIWNGYYVVLYLNTYALETGVDGDKDDDIHEQMIYGYDSDKKVFIMPRLTEKGIFERAEVPYHKVELAYKLARNWFLNNGESVFSKRNFYFEFTSFKLNESYDCINILHDHCQKMENDYSGKQMQVYVPRQRFKTRAKNYIVYTGLEVYGGIKEGIERSFYWAPDSNSENLTCKSANKDANRFLLRTLKNFYDYKSTLGRAMKHITEAEKIGENSDALIADLVNRYIISTEKFKNCYYIFLKFIKHSKPEFIDQIFQICNECYEEEQKILDWYYYRLHQYCYLDKSLMKQ